jgi:hypothetical protein
MADKFPKAEGVLSATPIKKGLKKDKTPYEIQQIVVELDGSWERDGVLHSDTYFMLFDTSKNVKAKLDEFASGDTIIISYVMKGRAYTKKDGTKGYDNAMMAIGIEHADINSGTRKATPAKAQPKPEPMPVDNDIPDDSDLPF